MRVILDTNIIVNNYYFNTPKFIGLLGYSKKTRSKVTIPDYVFQEVLKKYKEELEKYAEKEERDNRVLFNKNEKIDILSLVKKYELFLLKLLSDKKITIPTSKNVSSKKVFARALKSLPPFDSAGRGLRDTLIWLSIVDIVKSNPKEYFCFISSNSKDFGQKNLLPQLIEDLGKDISRLIYFNSLEEFLSSYGDQISFIDDNLFNEFFNKKDKFLLSLIDIDKISSSEIEDIPRYYDIEAVEDFSINNIDIQDFYVYNSNQKYYKVEVELIVNLDLDVAVYLRDEDYDSITNKHGFSWCSIDFSLLINKETKEIEIDKDIIPAVYYP